MLSAVVPGSGFVHNRRQRLGALVFLVSLVGVIWVGLEAPHNLRAALDLAFSPSRLTRAAIETAVCLVLWVAVAVGTFVVLRPRPAEPRWHLMGGGALVGALCLVVVAPVGLVVRDAFAQADVVKSVFTHNQTATRPTGVTPEDPWNGRSRVNVLLLGGDSGPYREGTRTDTMMLASLDTRTGRTVTFGLPRNLMDVPFPDDSPLHTVYPDGFTGPGDPGSWMLNAVYREIPILYPHILGKSADEGADAIKQAVEGATGLPVDYYVLIDFTGFRQMVDAMGGSHGERQRPRRDQRPDRRRDPADRATSSRGRTSTSTASTRCGTRAAATAPTTTSGCHASAAWSSAIVDKANPVNLLRRYQALAAAGGRVVTTDIPKELLPAFVQLALKAKDHQAKSVLFRSSTTFNPGAPDFDYMHQVVQKALAPHGQAPPPRGVPEPGRPGRLRLQPGPVLLSVGHRGVRRVQRGPRRDRDRGVREHGHHGVAGALVGR